MDGTRFFYVWATTPLTPPQGESVPPLTPHPPSSWPPRQGRPHWPATFPPPPHHHPPTHFALSPSLPPPHPLFFPLTSLHTVESADLSGSVLARALSARLATEAAGRAEAESRAEALGEALAAALRSGGGGGDECGPPWVGCDAAVAVLPLPLAQQHKQQQQATVPVGGGKRGGGGRKGGRAGGGRGENAAPVE